MSGNFLQWGVPALITVVGGTALTIAMTSANIASDLSNRTSAVLSSDMHGWAQVSFNGRDAILSGTVADQKVVDDVVARIASVHGVGAVKSTVVFAPFASPFPFAASIADGDLSLSGGVPDETAHAELLLATGAARDDLRVMSGAPARAEWRTAVDYGLAYLAQFDEGEIALADLTLNISGRARSSAAFDALALLQHDGTPAGVELGAVDIAPPLATPYEWRASFDGDSLSISGFAPDQAFIDRVRDVEPDSIPISTNMVLASGAPDRFEADALLLLRNLLQLENGTANISDGTATLRGAPPNLQVAQAVRAEVAPSGAAVTLEPPRVANYQFIATRSGDAVTLDGFVPDAATKTRLEAMEGVDASGLELARGAPDRFASAIEFGLDALSHLSEGRFTVSGTVLSIEGRAATVADFDTLGQMVALGAPQGLTLASADVKPPRATLFIWSAVRKADGKIALSGFVPSQAVRTALHEAVPVLAEDGSTLADGGPPDFEPMAKAGLGILPLLDTGKVLYDGDGWTLSGDVDSATKGFAVETAFDAAGLKAAGWTYEVNLPPAAKPAALPVIAPYVWRAQKRADGVTFTGFAPTEIFRQFLAHRVAGKIVDETNLGAGYPDDFIGTALAGFDALQQLDEGVLNFADGTWTLSGRSEGGTHRADIEKALATAAQTGAAHVDIRALDLPPAAKPYVWTAIKSGEGAVSLSGYVPTEVLKRFALGRASKVQADTTVLATGAPDGFITNVLAGLDVLSHLQSGTVNFDGGKWSVSGTPQTETDRAAALVAVSTASDGGADWAISISPSIVAPQPEPEPEPEAVAKAATPAVAHHFVFGANKSLGGAISLEGLVPADATKDYFGAIAGGVSTDALRIGDTLPPDFLRHADVGIRALAMLVDGQFGLDNDKWVFNGRAATEVERRAVLTNLDADPSASTWEIAVTLLPAIETCRARVAVFASRNAILFQSGSARMTDTSAPALDELASDLSACPEAIVDVEGHTDADGADDRNLALSVARAEAVVAALIERGIGADRLYAIGYGESLPVADNDTAAGKKANRRIAFTLRDAPQ